MRKAEIIVIGDIYATNGYGSAGGRIYGVGGVSPSLGASHFNQVKYIAEYEHTKSNNRNRRKEIK